MTKRLLLLLIICSSLLTLIGCTNQLVNGTANEVPAPKVDTTEQTDTTIDQANSETPPEKLVEVPSSTSPLPKEEKTAEIAKEVPLAATVKKELNTTEKVVSSTKVTTAKAVEKPVPAKTTTLAPEKVQEEVINEPKVGVSDTYVKVETEGFKPPTSDKDKKKQEEQQQLAKTKPIPVTPSRSYGTRTTPSKPRGRRMSKGTSTNTAFNFLSKEDLARNGTKEIRWLTFDEAQRNHAVAPKKWLIFAHTEWCANCPKMEQYLENSVLVDYINANYYPVMIDGEDRKNMGKFGFDESVGKNGTHEFVLYLTRGKPGYPTLAVWDESQSNPQARKGILNTYESYLYLKYFGDDFYKQYTWKEYLFLLGSK